MTLSYSDREHKLTSNLTIGGDNPAKVYNVGRHEVRVYENGEVTCRQPYGYQGDANQDLPNLEISIGGATWNEARDHWRHEIKHQMGWKA